MQKRGVVCRLIPCSCMSSSMPPVCMCATSTSARPAAAANYIHNEVADRDDYSCDGVHDGNEHLCEGAAGVNKGCGQAGGTRTYICDSADDSTDTVANGRKDGTLESRVSGTERCRRGRLWLTMIVLIGSWIGSFGI